MDDNANNPLPIRPRRARARAASETPGSDAFATQVVVDETVLQQQRRAKSAKTFNPWKSLQSVFSVALVVATLFTLWTPDNLFSNKIMSSMFQAVQPPVPNQSIPTQTPSPKPHIGIVSGHWGNDSGSTCTDGLTEAEVNLKIATMVQEILTREGYDVDLLKEFDPRLREYRALALVSIHNDSCDYINDQATGFKVAAASSTIFPEKATRLTACLTQRYKTITGLQFHYNTVTRDMTEYHAFSEIHSDTTAAIIETGFLNLDREILTKHTDLVAQGVASGILCFVRNEDIPNVPAATP